MKLLAIIFAIIAAVYGQLVTEDCQIVCSSDYKPVCGIGYYHGEHEWNTYTNVCTFEARNCLNRAKPYYTINGIKECTQIYRTRSSAPPPPAPVIFEKPEIIAGPYQERPRPIWESKNF